MKKPIKDYIFVAIQLMLFGVYVLDFDFFALIFPTLINWIGLSFLVIGVIIGLVAVMQLNSTLSPYPTPVIKGSLVKSGVFSLVRHPIYFAILSCSFGYGVYINSEYKILISIILLCLFNFKSKYEEELLMNKYAEYRSYQSKTGRLFPKIISNNC